MPVKLTTIAFLLFMVSYCKEKVEEPRLSAMQLQQKEKTARATIEKLAQQLGHGTAEQGLKIEKRGSDRPGSVFLLTTAEKPHIRWFEYVNSLEAIRDFFKLKTLFSGAAVDENLTWKSFRPATEKEIYLYAGSAIVHIQKMTALPGRPEIEKLENTLSSVNEAPGFVEDLPSNERRGQTLQFFSELKMLNTVLVDCTIAEYRWAENGQLFICQQADMKDARQRLDDMAARVKVSLEQDQVKRSNENIKVRILHHRGKDRVLYSVYQSGRFIYGIRGNLAKSLGQAIVNEISQRINSREKVSLYE